ncbi:hypothetical protein H9635_04035 [Solibacillus sp. A46]|uniref:Uncharacterized protein n=1 Tax=Solibacillus faecavium TaxID=2762221 RepID=A0ABR8XVC3_9BACL|nr:hypothetical protein [Solibacillus faecavium]MBD8035898.1 hypothetical protein [Solibacillus faecavium]
MIQNFQVEKHIRNCLMVGVYANQLIINEKLELTSSEFVICLRNPITLETWYWRLEWFEDTSGQDTLIIHEQETPEPLHYTTEPIISNDYFILNSRFSFNDNTINQVIGYGYKDTNHDILSSLVFEFENSYLLVNTGPVIEMNYVKVKPNIQRDIIFTLN